MNEKLVDARGLSCPEPVLLTQNALKQYRGEAFTVAVSSPTARDNVSGLLTQKGYALKTEQKDDAWFIEASPK